MNDLQLLLGFRDVASSPPLDVFFAWISQTTWFSLPLLGIVLAILWRQQGRDGAKLWLVLVVATIAGDQLGALLKYIIGQMRPCAELPDLIQVPQTLFHVTCSKGLNGMPSNHAWNFFATTAFLGITLRSVRWTGIFAVIALLVSLSRVYLGVHYPSQVVVGAALGAVYGCLVAFAALQYLPFAQRIRNRKPADS